MFSPFLSLALALALGMGAAAQTVADKVAMLRLAPTEVDRLKILQDGEVSSFCTDKFARVLYSSLSSLFSTSSTRALVRRQGPLDILLLHRPRTSLPLLAMAWQ